MTDPVITIVRRHLIDTGEDEHIEPEALILHYDYVEFAHHHVYMRCPDGSMLVKSRCSLEDATAYFEKHLSTWLTLWDATEAERLV